MGRNREVLEERAEPGRFSRLPEPVRLEDTVTSSEGTTYPPEKDDYWREVEWMLRTSGLG